MSIGTPEVVHDLSLKRGKPIGSKDVPPRKRRTQMSIGTPEVVHELRLKRRRSIGSKEDLSFDMFLLSVFDYYTKISLTS